MPKPYTYRPWSSEETARLLDMFLNDVPLLKIARYFSRTEAAVKARVLLVTTREQRLARSRVASVTRTYLPTPEEIAAACEKIRDGWDVKEPARRGEPYYPVELQAVAVQVGLDLTGAS